MITIEHLQVELEVDGDDAAVFERLFRRCIEQWRRAERERERDEHSLARARAIGGAGGNGNGRGRGGAP